MPTSLSSRALALSAAIAVAAVALVGLPAITPTISIDSASAANPAACVPSYGPYGNLASLGTGVRGTDPDLGVYINGDFDLTTGTSELEGKYLVTGDVDFNTADYFNIGVVGIGSQYVPPAGSDILTAGGNVTVGTTTMLDVGTSVGGNIRAAGTVGPTGKLQFVPGSGIITDPAAGTRYAAEATNFNAVSDFYAPMETTGTAVSTTGIVTFTGDGTSARQVFSIAGTLLGSSSTAGTKTMAFTNIPTDAIIVINVTGTTAVVSANTFSLNGTLISNPYADPFGEVTQSILWNFPTATSVTLGYGDQLLGSVLIPTANSSLDIQTSTNGRVYVNGDVTMGGPNGLEMHNYGFRQEECTATGSFTITKALSDPDDVTLATRSYTGTYSCVDSLGASVGSGTWSLLAGETETVTDLPVGSTCSAAENSLTPAPSATDPTYTWATPSYSAASVVVTSSSAVGITVQNAVLQGVGSLSITKTLDDPDGVVTDGRLFSGTYECRVGTSVVASGTWSTTAGGAASVVTDIPAPSSCAIAETSLGTAPSATDASYQWVTPTYAPAASVSVTSGATTGVVVQNEVRRGLGDLEMIKILDDPFDVVNLDRVYTGTWSCTFGGIQIEGGTWSTTAGAAPLTLATDLPVGSSCVLAEDAATLAAPPLAGFPQYIWREPTISPATVSILEGVVHRFTVTNIVYDPIGEVSSLAHSGTDSVLPIVIGAGTMGAGILFLFLARRRRVALRG